MLTVIGLFLVNLAMILVQVRGAGQGTGRGGGVRSQGGLVKVIFYLGGAAGAGWVANCVGVRGAEGQPCCRERAVHRAPVHTSSHTHMVQVSGALGEQVVQGSLQFTDLLGVSGVE